LNSGKEQDEQDEQEQDVVRQDVVSSLRFAGGIMPLPMVTHLCQPLVIINCQQDR
jgi:hypothetical protein